MVYNWKSGDRLSAQQELDQVTSALGQKSVLVVNQPFFLLSVPWYNAWLEYASGKGSTRPPPINNSDLLEDQQLRRGLGENYDYKIVNLHVWLRLSAW